VEHLLAAFGTAALLVTASMWIERAVARTWDAVPAVTAETAPAALRPTVSRTPADAGLLGRLEVRRIGLSAAVREGVDDATLDVSIGHVPGTARPGRAGNAGLAAHRDAEFRPLRNIRIGDEILFVGPDGETRYRVQWTRVVPPERVDVLGAAPGASSLTLVTCYPFGFLGRAPMRFVVRADRV
jgi:sortase A